MYINDRDQINYHGFLKALREMQGANLRQVAEGICSDSEVYRTEIGDRLPEKLLRDRITARLGVSGEEYEEYLRPEEYRQWEIRMYILNHINKGDIEAVKKGIEIYDEIPDKNPVMEQFIDTMRYMHAQMKGESAELLRARIELAVVHTIPDISSAFIGGQLLADQELNLIAEYTHLREYYGSKEDEFEWRLSQYLQILEYIDQSYIDVIGRSKVYPKTVYYICEWILKYDLEKNTLDLAYDLCTKSIELLRDASRLYYFVELLECRKKIIECLLKYEVDVEQSLQLKEIYEKDCEWEKLFKELYTEYDVPVYMKNFTYLYVETECNSAVEVIRTRRNMLKLSRLKVSDNICTEKTVERFENYAHSPSIIIVRDIFERIGLCAEYKRARVITDNAEMLRVANKLINSLNKWNIKESEKYLQILKNGLHMDISFNEQSIKRHGNLVEIRKKEKDMEEMYISALEILELTVPFWSIIRGKNLYLTREEWLCMYDLAFKVNGEVSDTCLNIIYKKCIDTFNKDIEMARLCVYEPLMGELASYLGDIGKMELSVMLSEKLLKECLFSRRLVVIVENLYNKFWIYQIMQRSNVERDNIMLTEYLNKCILLSEITKKSNWKAFLQQKRDNFLEEISK